MCSTLQIQHLQKPCHWLSAALARKKITEKLTADVHCAVTDLAGSELIMLLGLNGLWCLILHVCKWWSKLVKLAAWIRVCGLDSPLPVSKCWKGGGEVWREPLLLWERKHFKSSNCLLHTGLSWVLIKFLVLFLTEKNVDNTFRWKNLYLSIFIVNCTLCACSFPENNANYQLLGIWAFVWHFSEGKKIPASI